MPAKNPLLSKTVLINVLTAVGAALVWAGDHAALIGLGPYGPQIVIAINAVNLVLRFLTNQPLDFSVFSGGGKIAPLVACMLMPALAFAAPPSARINGPSGGIPGDSIALDASNSVGNVFRWDVTRRGFVAADTHYRVASDGQRLEINSYPGVYDVTLTVANEEGIDLKRHTLVVWNVSPPTPLPPPSPNPDVPLPGPPNPAPPMPPDPEPLPTPEPSPPTPPEPAPPEPPTPDVPDGRFGAAKFARDAAVTHVPADAQRPIEAAKVAAAWEGVAAAISAGTIRGLLSIRSAVVDANRQALGASLPRWSTFGEVLAVRLGELYDTGALETSDDWATLLNEGALGLRAVQ